MKSLEFLRKRPIAHRGLWNMKEQIPENSLPAFEKAAVEKYPIELDVHLLKDGTVVVFHDDNLKRMTGVDKKIKDCTYDEIKDLKLKDTKYGIPKLSEVLDLVNGRVSILMEFKQDLKLGITEAAAMRLLQNYNGDYAIQSFSIKSLIWFRRKFPNVARGQLSESKLCFMFLTKPDFISYAIASFPNKRVHHFMKNGGLVLGWTVRTNEDLQKAKKYCNNFIGENFETLDLTIFDSNCNQLQN